MNIATKCYAVLLTTLFLGACGLNQTLAKTPAQVKSVLEQTYKDQNIEVTTIKKAPVEGWYEAVLSGNQLIYVDKDARYIFDGELIDLKEKKNITAERQKELNKVDFSQLPLDNAIKEVRGNGQNKIVVFSDPDCPYCHKLEVEFGKLTDVTIYTLLIPIDTLHPDARYHSEQLWCQKDRTNAWISYMRNGKAPQKVDKCENPIEKNLAVADKLGFHGTPTIVFPNGQIMPGYAPATVLQKTIAENQS